MKEKSLEKKTKGEEKINEGKLRRRGLQEDYQKEEKKRDVYEREELREEL